MLNAARLHKRSALDQPRSLRCPMARCPTTALLRMGTLIILIGASCSTAGLRSGRARRAAGGDGQPAAPARARRVGRVHRAVRRRGICRDPRAGQRLSRPKSISTDGQIVKQGDLLFVIDPRPYEATLAAAQGAARPGECAGRPRDPAARALRRAAQEGFRAGKQLRPARLRAEGRDGRRSNPPRPRSARPSSMSSSPGSRRRSPGRISNHQVSIGNLISGGDSGHDPGC